MSSLVRTDDMSTFGVGSSARGVKHSQVEVLMNAQILEVFARKVQQDWIIQLSEVKLFGMSQRGLNKPPDSRRIR